MNRRAFTLIECVLTLVILSVAVPATLAMMHDATIARTESVMASRASWLGNLLCEQILADVASNDPALGMDALSDAAAYLEAPGTGLMDRLASELLEYEALGLDAEITIGPLIALAGIATGDPSQDIYRRITVTVSYRSASAAAREVPFEMLVTDPTL